MKARATIAAFLVSLAVEGAAGATPPLRVEVSAPRVTVGDLVPGAPPDAAAVDLGPTPVAGASRLIDRASVLDALRAAQVSEPRRIPAAVRVLRRMQSLSPAQVERAVRGALATTTLPRGATVTAVRCPRALVLPAGWRAVTVDLPRIPRRAGNFSTTALVSFQRDAELLARVPLPVELALPPEAAIPDAARGAALTLVVRQGLVEVSVGAHAATDADVGDTLPVVLRPSGRVLRARLIERDRALALEGP